MAGKFNRPPEIALSNRQSCNSTNSRSIADDARVGAWWERRSMYQVRCQFIFFRKVNKGGVRLFKGQKG